MKPLAGNGAVVAACVAAVFLAAGGVRAIMDLPSLARQVERRHRDWQSLRERAARLDADLAYLRERAEMRGGNALAEWFRARHSAWAVEWKDRGAERVSRDWAIRRVQAIFPRVALAEFAETLEAMRAEQSPWRAAEISIAALGAEPGLAQVTVEWEAPERVPAEGP